jgi:glycogen debranching enzyme
MHTILHGKRFFIVDDRGDATRGVEGLYAHDTRMVSQWRLLVDGKRPQPLGEPSGPHHHRRFVQRNIKGDRLAADTLIVERELVVDDALYERLTLDNVTEELLEFDVALSVATDFRDLFDVKRVAFEERGDDVGAMALVTSDLHPDTVRVSATEDGARIEHGTDHLAINTTQPATVNGDGALRWTVKLGPRERWSCDVRAAWDDDGATDIDVHERRAHVEASVAAWLTDTPHLTGPEDVRRTYRTSVNDLAALRIGGPRGSMLPAAGMPWFMTAFGRDTLITCLQTVALGADRAQGAIEYLAERQATTDMPEVDAEPGKILHEVREGAIAERGYDLYYGSIDSTPLFLILLDETHRWTGDDEFVTRMRPNAMAALEWIERWGDPDGDGYLEYEKRSAQGLDNQSWKDSWDSQRFHNGRLASGAIAPAEVQGYAYDARVRMARLARTVWGDSETADRLERNASTLRERFNADFWVPADDGTAADDPRAGGYFALALDGDKQPVDALTSNIGHLLWSGIVAEEYVPQVVRHLVSTPLFNGWGVRTMSSLDAAYNPISYHNGTVWPHDTSLCVAGLVRAGAREEAATVARALFDAAAEFDGRLPEVFAGLSRSRTRHPVEYPTASRPQAWAAATPIFLLSELLGLSPDHSNSALTVTTESMPDWLNGLAWHGITAFGTRWNVSVDHGKVALQRQ